MTSSLTFSHYEMPLTADPVRAGATNATDANRALPVDRLLAITRRFLVATLGALVVNAGYAADASSSSLPLNLALTATATANSEHNQQYLARFAIDGVIPAAGGQADAGQAWCVQGNTHRQGAELALHWPEPVSVAEVLYWGRTAWFAEECWKDYEIWPDDAAAPIVSGRFEMGHGPQRIVLPQPL